MPNISYSDVLEDLEQKRQSLDAAIAAIRRIYEVFPEAAASDSASDPHQAHISDISYSPDAIEIDLESAEELAKFLRPANARNGHAKCVVPKGLMEGGTVLARTLKFLVDNPGPHHTLTIAKAAKSTYGSVASVLAKAVIKGYVTRTAPGNFAAL